MHRRPCITRGRDRRGAGAPLLSAWPHNGNMRAARALLAATTLLVTTLLLAAAAAGEALQPSEVYRVVEGRDTVTYLAPSVAFAAFDALELAPAPSLEACAAACRDLSTCVEFEYCSSEVSPQAGPPRAESAGAAAPPPSVHTLHPRRATAGCTPQDGCTGVEPKLRNLDCRLMASHCTLLPMVEAAGPWIKRVSGGRGCAPVMHGCKCMV